MDAPLTGRQRRYLKGLAHGQKVLVCRIGKEGLTESAVAGIGRDLDAHELLKVQFRAGGDTNRKQLSRRLAESLNAHLVQLIGYRAVLYRRNRQKPRISLPG